ncbi:MAG: alanine racemase [Hyphomicrobiales bacterium]|nr:alanine racemase [Hyphomicrobiales bacterium]
MAATAVDLSRETHLAGGRLIVDLAALAANWRDLDKRSGDATTAAVVKGNGYGTGLEAASRALAAAGCHTFFVALPDEGLGVRATVPTATIYVLDGLLAGATEQYAAADLRPVLSSVPEIEEWSAYRRAGGSTQAALHVDTGMNRLGLSVADVAGLAEERALESLGLMLVMSHLACADLQDHAHNHQQLARFHEVRGMVPDVPASIANSAGVFLGADYHLDLVRPGIALFGGEAVQGIANPMHNVVTLEARVLQVRDASHAETVGYGATESLDRASQLAIAAVGYADGYPRHASSSNDVTGGRAWINGHSAPIVGRISMDLIALDVTDIPGTKRGDWVELFGHNIPVDEVAELAGTIGYELLTRLGHRHHRIYLEAR